MKRCLSCFAATLLLCAFAVSITVALGFSSTVFADAADYSVIRGGATLETAEDDYTKIVGCDADTDVVSNETVTVDGTDFVFYTENAPAGSVLGLYFSSAKENTAFGTNSPLCITLFKYTTSGGSKQARIYFGDNKFGGLFNVQQSLAYTEPDINSRPASTKVTDGTMVMNDSDTVGIVLSFSSENESWYKVRITPLNSSTFSGETNTLYIEKSVLAEHLDADGKLYVHFGAVCPENAVTNLYVQIDEEGGFTNPDADTDINGDLVLDPEQEWSRYLVNHGCKNIEYSDSGVYVRAFGAYPIRLNYNKALDLSKESGINIRLVMNDAAFYSSNKGTYFNVSVLSEPDKWYQDMSSETDGFMIQLQLKETQTIMKIFKMTLSGSSYSMREISRLELSDKIQDGSEMNFNIAYSSELDFVNQEYKNTYIITLNGEELSITEEIMQAGGVGTSFNPEEVYVGFGAKSDDVTCPYLFTIRSVDDYSWYKETVDEPGEETDVDNDAPSAESGGCSGTAAVSGLLCAVLLICGTAFSCMVKKRG